ncbi:hypothetical protein ACBI99_44880 [Nonomuraea sp. ATR24]|uniref:hypothetical protein n=1 Tax=Nonomuraea sp. ATR24 TaxID=1676744 RepID=UPI0035C077EE
MKSPSIFNLHDPADQVFFLLGGVEALEDEGQQQFLASDVIPTEVHGCTDADLIELGFELGDVVPGDPLFRYAKLPPGWKRCPEEDPRGSYLVDGHGNRRASIFYKAAFYDRKASMSINPRRRAK